MKRILTLALVCLAMAFTAMAQSMKVYQDGQLKAIYYFNQSDSLVFSDDFPFPPGEEDENDPVDPTPGKPIVSYSHAVDLGLSVKWADMNVGAEKPEDYGWYLAWGETEEKTIYDWDTYFDSNYEKYSTNRKTVLDPEDDAAHVNWGGDWRMPTDAELTELRSKCYWTLTTQNGVNGMKIIGPNGNSLFLPAAGYRNINLLNDVDSVGNYWSCTLSDFAGSNFVFFYSGDTCRSWGDRNCGRSVRPVCSE